MRICGVIHLYRYPIADNFDFINQALYHSSGFSSKSYKVEFNLLKENIIQLQVNYKDNRLPHYSDLMLSKIHENKIKVKADNKRSIFTKNEFNIEFSLNPFSLGIKRNNRLILKSEQNFIVLNEKRTIFQFCKEKNTPFWGFGEKTGRFNKNGQILKMWNSDVMPEMPYNYMRDDYDPAYASIPFFISHINNVYWGFLLDNPCATFFDNGHQDKNKFYFGSYDGQSTLYIIYGPTMDHVIQKMSHLTGKIEMPPLWSLGHHQARWSYESSKAVREVIHQYHKNKIPLSSIWLDIDYMDNYKIFTWNKKSIKDYKKLINDLHKQKMALVTIVDPGVKKEYKFPIYQEGKKLNLFCKTKEQKEFIGYVWPGKTVFPDFSLPETQKWWANKISQFLNKVIDGIWIDMNDPSTGESDSDMMLFQRGKVEHHFYHNQYANLMAKATKNGFRENDTTKREFILTRSAYTGIHKYAAVWTGDNVSSWEHLRMCIPESLNLSLSGVSFNGPDIGGFTYHTTEQLITRWYQACFLFPFCRNHSAKWSKDQEPYRFSRQAISIMRNFINLRYKYLPYLYNLFYEHYEMGHPILRPLMYEYNEKKYFDIGDQFFVGPNILLAPVLTEESKRTFFLPKGYWYNYFKKVWEVGDKRVSAHVPFDKTVMYMRDGAIIPVLQGEEFHQPRSQDFKNTEFNIYLHQKREAQMNYYEDDGKSQDYKRGLFNLYQIHCVKNNQDCEIQIKKLHHHYKKGLNKFIFNVHLGKKLLHKVVHM